jgi:hypothetical protein
VKVGGGLNSHRALAARGEHEHEHLATGRVHFLGGNGQDRVEAVAD